MTTIRRHWLTALCCAGVLAAGVSANAPTADACGGFFCNTTQPVNQAAERIIFADNDDNTVTAVVQIMYQGPSQHFAWVLPVPGSPQVDVSATQAFDRLQQVTNPVYRLNTTVEGDCKSDGKLAFPTAGADASAGANNGAPNEGVPPVQVVNSGHVGPYDYTTISVDNHSDDPAQAAIDWLSTNNYDVSALGKQTLRPYLEDGMNLLAFRLSKDSDSGDIRPIRITYDAELPMIPIKLTAVAANDDMGVLVWVLSHHRAVPANYKALRLDEAAINWLNPANNYGDVVTRAANEADGQGFVTELAWPTDQPLPAPTQFAQSVNLSDVIFTPDEVDAWQAIQHQDWTHREGDLLQRALAFRQLDGFVEVVDATVPLPDGTSAEQFVQAPYQASGLLDRSDIADFDPQSFIQQLKMQVIDPIQKTQDLFDTHDYLTRLYTTMSAAEMTLDPMFDFNADLGDDSNVHVADQVIECGDQEYTRAEAPWHVDLPQGDKVYGTGNAWPLGSELPATRTIIQEHNAGEGDVVEDHSAKISAAVKANNQRITDKVSSGFGCAVADPASANLARNLALTLMFGAFGLLLVRRRRS